jgi:ferritin
MISEKMEKALNEQIAIEGHSSFVYLSIATWCDKEGLEGCNQFFRRQADEERFHMLKIFDYMSEVDAFAKTPAIEQVPHEYNSIQDIFKLTLQQEQKVTSSINDLVRLSLDENDYTTKNFLEWYVAEQREEENLIRGILDKIKLIGTGSMSLYYIDKEIDKINQAELAAEGGEE